MRKRGIDEPSEVFDEGRGTARTVFSVTRHVVLTPNNTCPRYFVALRAWREPSLKRQN
jgi:hypothetical protein